MAMTKQRRTPNFSIFFLVVVLMMCVSLLWQMDSQTTRLQYSQVRQLFLQEKVETVDIDTDLTMTLTLREAVNGSKTVQYKLYSFQLFYDDLNDLVQQQYAERHHQGL